MATTQATETTTTSQISSKPGLGILKAAYNLGYRFGTQEAKGEGAEQLTLDNISFVAEWNSYNNISALWKLNEIAEFHIKVARPAFILGFEDGVLAEQVRQEGK